MRIDTNPAAAASIAKDERTSKVTQKRPNADMDLAGVTASLSADSARLNALHSQLASVSEIRQEKVESLRAAVLDGSYTADSTATASAMLSEYSGGGMRF